MFRLRGSHPVSRAFPDRFGYMLHADGTSPVWALQPRSHKDFGLGWSRFARRYSGNLG